MPKRTDIHSILIIGAGPIVIGQACEFDYSGAQACKALKDEGYRVILVNSNPATIMTDPGLADATYIEPITPEMVETIIAAERPDALLPTMGGQTALNTAMELADDGVLEKYGVELIGAKRRRHRQGRGPADVPRRHGRDRPRIARAAPSPTRWRKRARRSAQSACPRSSGPRFTLGGTGGGIAYNREEFEQIVAGGLDASPDHEVLIEESVLGWKEFEMEVVRDRADNCIIVCSIENVDPMGVHTGDSITVAPALTLTDKEYQRMRDASIAVLREIGVDTGGSNVQFARQPRRRAHGRHRDEPARVALLGAGLEGHRLPDRQGRRQARGRLHAGRARQRHHPRRRRPASSRPSTTSWSRSRASPSRSSPARRPLLTTSMKSVGEAMAIGRSFAEALQKGAALHGDRALRPRRDRAAGRRRRADAFRAALSQPAARPPPDGGRRRCAPG